MEVIYRVNGKEFNTQESAKDYELELERKAQERIEKEQEKDNRFKELCDAANKYVELYNAYEKDYGTKKLKINSDNCSTYLRSEKDKKYDNLSDLIQDILELF